MSATFDRRTFADRVRAGEVADFEEAIAGEIDVWHERGDDGTPLHAWLGLTWEQYRVWAEKSGDLEGLLLNRALCSRCTDGAEILCACGDSISGEIRRVEEKAGEERKARAALAERLKAADARCVHQRRELARLNAQIVENHREHVKHARTLIVERDGLKSTMAQRDGTIRGLRFRLAEVEAERVPLAQCDRLHDLCERIMDALPDFDPGDALCGDLDDGVRLVVAQRELGRKREERLREALRTIVLEKTIYCDGYECSKPATYQDGDDRWCAECLEGAKKTAGKWGRKFKPVPFIQSWTVRVAREALDAAGDPP